MEDGPCCARGDKARGSSVGHRRALGLSADGAGRGDGQRGEDDGAELLTRGPGKQGAAGRGRGGGRAEQPDWAGWVSAQAETSSFFFTFKPRFKFKFKFIQKP